MTTVRTALGALTALQIVLSLSALLAWADPRVADLTEYRLAQVESAIKDMRAAHERIAYLLIGNLCAVVASAGVYVFKMKSRRPSDD